MQDINYDLVKLLTNKLDMISRLERFYVQDADEVKCHSLDTLKQILEDEKKHVDIVAEEIRLRVKNDLFN